MRTWHKNIFRSIAVQMGQFLLLLSSRTKLQHGLTGRFNQRIDNIWQQALLPTSGLLSQQARIAIWILPTSPSPERVVADTACSSSTFGVPSATSWKACAGLVCTPKRSNSSPLTSRTMIKKQKTKSKNESCDKFCCNAATGSRSFGSGLSSKQPQQCEC